MASNSKKPNGKEMAMCKYGLGCYQKNPEHHRKFRHPTKIIPNEETLDVEVEAFKPSPRKKGDNLKNSSYREQNQENLTKLSIRREKIQDFDITSDSYLKMSTNCTQPLYPKRKLGEDASGMFVTSLKEAAPSFLLNKKAAAEDIAGQFSFSNLKESHDENSRKHSPRKCACYKDCCLLPCSVDVRLNIKEKLMVDMPSDFYDLWEFCRELCAEDPSEAFAELEFHLVGPYDVLAGKISCEDITDNILCHYRYYYDPPEFQTVITRNGDDCFHIGYFRDVPSEMPFGLASNSASIGPKFKIVGDNIFSAVNSELSAALKKNKKNTKKLLRIQGDLKAFATERNYCLDFETPKTKDRTKKVVAKTFHGLGIVVPYDKVRELGYRPLPETNARLKAIFTKIVDSQTEEARINNRIDLDEILTCTQFANDECDYGTGLELGIDLFCYGDPYFHQDILSVLPLAYDLLGRCEYSKVIRAHLTCRRKGNRVSIWDKD